VRVDFGAELPLGACSGGARIIAHRRPGAPPAPSAALVARWRPEATSPMPASSPTSRTAKTRRRASSASRRRAS